VRISQQLDPGSIPVEKGSAIFEDRLKLTTSEDGEAQTIRYGPESALPFPETVTRLKDSTWPGQERNAQWLIHIHTIERDLNN